MLMFGGVAGTCCAAAAAAAARAPNAGKSDISNISVH